MVMDWGGTSFGYQDGDNLWTHNGHHVGKFYGDEIYSPDGSYLGEIRNGNRLITHQSKRSRRRGGFTPFANRVGYVNKLNYVGYVLYVGYEDFPTPEDL